MVIILMAAEHKVGRPGDPDRGRTIAPAAVS